MSSLPGSFGLVLSRALTRLITGCCKTTVPSKGADKCYLVWGVISQACVAPSAWLFVGFLDGSYYSCAKHQFPCSKNATELLKHEALKSESQMISWCILVGGVATALTGFLVQRSCSRFTWHQYLYEELYEEYEITEYESEAKKRAQALAKVNVAVFMDLEERSKIDWDTISTVPSQEPIDPNEKKDPLITSLQRWVLHHPPEDKEKEEETPT
ncbi:calcium homeostasis modulator protein 6-like isoform X2 [Lingula anatina]|uniref:Calcium homeostasis modulator protein 6-like isoform X2 n=1 Tax=Lingula anatina TaxID=7574 RepID=A0A1S3IY83_LINAN|nr:calcium homeostasis modulator protein 6-like isoform X2 [Lingula anatina]|eukprot:XP_013403155.1 calcium homeostasis modulator protein 6-like isoform X2 [Lingula anatina]